MITAPARTAHQERLSEAMKRHWRKRKAMPAREGTFRYVRWPDVDAYHARGWMVVGDLGATHGLWSALMWRCDCEVAR